MTPGVWWVLAEYDEAAGAYHMNEATGNGGYDYVYVVQWLDEEENILLTEQITNRIEHTTPVRAARFPLCCSSRRIFSPMCSTPRA